MAVKFCRTGGLLNPLVGILQASTCEYVGLCRKVCMFKLMSAPRDFGRQAWRKLSEFWTYNLVTTNTWKNVSGRVPTEFE
eukprot:4941650-Amphidinium_carterae.1